MSKADGTVLSVGIALFPDFGRSDHQNSITIPASFYSFTTYLLLPGLGT